MKKHKISKETNLEQLEDILFTMFDEQIEVQDTDEGDLPSDDSDDDLDEYLADYNDSPLKSLQVKPSKLAEEEEKVAPVGGETTEQVKSRKPSAEDQSATPTEPNEDFVNQLLMMGFSLIQAKAALIKCKNESVAMAIETIMEMQATEQAKKPKEVEMIKKTKIQSWVCTICTYINPEAKASCEMCGQPPPLSAFVEVKSEDDIKKEKEELEKKQKEEEDKVRQEEEARVKLEEDARKKKEAEEEAVKQFALLREQTKQYYTTAKVVDYLFAEYNHGKDTKPLLSAVVFQNETRCDIQFVRFGYSWRYLKMFVGGHHTTTPKCQVCDIPFTSTPKCLQHVFEYHQALVECYYPIYIGSQHQSHKWQTKTNRHAFKFMVAEECGTLIFPFEQVQSVCQVGTNIAPGTCDCYLYIIGVGKKKLNDAE